MSPAPARPLVAVVTSGLGHRNGGVGVVAAEMVRALEPHADVTVWTNRVERGRTGRLGLFALDVLPSLVRRPALVCYEHLDLARVHRLVPWLVGVPAVAFLHGTEVWRPVEGGKRRGLFAMRRLLTNSHTTEALARAANPWLPEVHVTWLGVASRPPPSTDARAPMAVIVGRMDPTERRKGHDWVLDAWPEIRGAVPDARLVVVGGGADRDWLEARARPLGGVSFTGVVGDIERDRLYREARVFLFPSQQEGFGLAAIEAAASGTAVLGLKGTVMEELLGGGRGAVLADGPDGASIARAAIPLLGDATAARELGLAGRARVEETFLTSHFERRFLDALSPWLSRRS